MIHAYSREQGLSPLDVLVAKEKMQVVVRLWHRIAKKLTSDELEDFVKYLVEKRTYKEIATVNPLVIQVRSKKAKIKRQNAQSGRGFRRISRIIKKIRELRTDDDVIYMYKEITDNPSEKVAGFPVIQLGWPVTFLQKHVIRSEFTKPKSTRRPEWVNRTRCMIPEYLSDCFGDEETKCSLCGRHCKRKEVN